MTFDGFPSAREKLTPIPETFFDQLLPEIEQLAELKLILYAFWFLHQQDKDQQYFTLPELCADPVLVQAFSPEPEQGLRAALEAAVARRALLQLEATGQQLYFLNTPRGRAAVKAFQGGSWQPEPGLRPAAELRGERPNIFTLYEENIGPLTPLVSEILQDAERSYPVGWIEDAIRIAVEKNVRKWRYVDAILQSWQKEGRSEKDRRNVEKDRRKYIDGEYSDIIEH